MSRAGHETNRSEIGERCRVGRMHHVGKRNDTVAQNAQALATTIAAHRNIELGVGPE